MTPQRHKDEPITDEELAAIAEDFEELGTLRMREAEEPYHDDDIAWITRSYLHAFRLLSAYRELKAENEELRERLRKIVPGPGSVIEVNGMTLTIHDKPEPDPQIVFVRDPRMPS